MSDFENIPNEEMQEEVPGTEPKAQEGSIAEELTVAGNQLVREVERLINEGNVRRLIIKQEDRVLLEVSLTLGVVGAGALAIFAPMGAVLLAAVAALAAAVSKVTIVIERGNQGNDLEIPPSDEGIDLEMPPSDER